MSTLIVIVKVIVKVKVKVKEKREKERRLHALTKGGKRMRSLWTEANREDLEFLLKEGYQVPKISKMIGLSPASIYNELKMTLTPEEYADKRFIKYTAERAWEMERKARSGKKEMPDDAE